MTVYRGANSVSVTHAPVTCVYTSIVNNMFIQHCVIYESDAGDCAQSLCTCAAAFRANNVVSLVGAIHHAMESTMAKHSQADREQLVASPDWSPFGVVGVMLNRVATAPWSAKEKVAKFVELYMLVIKAPQCICDKPSCGCSAVLANITLVMHLCRCGRGRS